MGLIVSGCSFVSLGLFKGWRKTFWYVFFDIHEVTMMELSDYDVTSVTSCGENVWCEFEKIFEILSTEKSEYGVES